jgi:hypothetical protein
MLIVNQGIQRVYKLLKELNGSIFIMFLNFLFTIHSASRINPYEFADCIISVSLPQTLKSHTTVFFNSCIVL